MIRRGAASRVASLFFLTPSVTAVMAWWLFNESIPSLAIAGMALTAAGVAHHARRGARYAVMKPKKLLLLSVSAGAGHARAAEALRVAADAQGATATHLDAMDFVPDGFRTLYTEWYLSLVNRQPALWGYLYEKTHRADPASLSQRLRRKIERLNTRALVRAINESKADAIVCTHFLPAELLSTLTSRGQFGTPVWVQVTDFDCIAYGCILGWPATLRATRRLHFVCARRHCGPLHSHHRHSDHARLWRRTEIASNVQTRWASMQPSRRCS